MLPIWLEFTANKITFFNVVVMVLYSMFFSAYLLSLMPAKTFVKLRYRLAFGLVWVILTVIMGGMPNVVVHVCIPGLEGAFSFYDGSFAIYFWEHFWFFVNLYALHFVWEGDVDA